MIEGKDDDRFPGDGPDEDRFADAVEKDVHGTALPAWEDYIRKPENVQDWYSVLLQMKGEYERKISDFNAQLKTEKQRHFRMGDPGKDKWFAIEADLNARRASANRVKSLVEDRIREAKLALADMGEAPAHLKQRVEFLQDEVRRLMLENAKLREQLGIK
jgi:hypothetical protein